MAARTRYRRPPARGTTKGNRYAGSCELCGEAVPERAGIVTYRDGWHLTHRPLVWSGSPVSGRYTNGCPGEAEAINRKGGWSQ